MQQRKMGGHSERKCICLYHQLLSQQENISNSVIGLDCMDGQFTSTYIISAYQVVSLIPDFETVSQRLPPPIKLTDTIHLYNRNIVDSGIIYP